MAPDGRTVIVGAFDGLWQIETKGTLRKPSVSTSRGPRSSLWLPTATLCWPRAGRAPKHSGSGISPPAGNGFPCSTIQGLTFQRSASEPTGRRSYGVALPARRKCTIFTRDLSTTVERALLIASLEYFAATFGKMALSPDGKVLAMSLGLGKGGAGGGPLGHGDWTATRYSLRAYPPHRVPDFLAGRQRVGHWFGRYGQSLGCGRRSERATFPLGGWVHALAFSADGKTLAAGKAESKIAVWDPKSDK